MDRTYRPSLIHIPLHCSVADEEILGIGLTSNIASNVLPLWLADMYPWRCVATCSTGTYLYN